MHGKASFSSINHRNSKGLDNARWGRGRPPLVVPLPGIFSDLINWKGGDGALQARRERNTSLFKAEVMTLVNLRDFLHL